MIIRISKNIKENLDPIVETIIKQTISYMLMEQDIHNINTYIDESIGIPYKGKEVFTKLSCKASYETLNIEVSYADEETPEYSTYEIDDKDIPDTSHDDLIFKLVENEYGMLDRLSLILYLEDKINEPNNTYTAKDIVKLIDEFPVGMINAKVTCDSCAYHHPLWYENANPCNLNKYPISDDIKYCQRYRRRNL